MSRSGQWPLCVQELVASRGVEVRQVSSCREARDPARLSEVDAVVLSDAGLIEYSHAANRDLHLLADALASHGVIGVIPLPGISGVVPGNENAFALAPAEMSAEELWGRLSTARQYQPMLRRMEDQVAAMQRLGKKLNQHFVEVDQELRLASRLQRDFLPQNMPEVGDIRFSVLYRPATWVSGDVYDVRRLDETRTGFYVADAVGHGVAAGLLTMFLKQSIVGKRVLKNSYSIIDPSEVLATLNSELADQELPNCQFVTACYGVVDSASCELRFARGGHPHPIHVGAGGRCTECRVVGGLLGVFKDETFGGMTVALEPGDKLVLYSDGLEDVIVSRRQRDHGPVVFTPEFRELARQPGPALLKGLVDRLDQTEGSLTPLDDQTCVIVERLRA